MLVEGVILAAGLSSRFPEYKMEAMLGDYTVLDRAILSMASQTTKIYVITGHNNEIVEKICSKYDFVTTVHNSNFRDGMFSSVKLGASLIKAKRFFLLPGDYPVVDIETYKKLLKKNSDVIIPSYDFKAGHPILMTHNVANKLISSDAQHLRAFLKDFDKEFVPVKDPGILLDIDEYDDYEFVKGRLKCK